MLVQPGCANMIKRISQGGLAHLLTVRGSTEEAVVVKSGSGKNGLLIYQSMADTSISIDETRQSVQKKRS